MNNDSLLDLKSLYEKMLNNMDGCLEFDQINKCMLAELKTMVWI